MRPGGQLQVFVLIGFVGQGKQGGYAFFKNDAKGTVNLQCSAFSVRSCSSSLSLLVTGLVRELLEPGLGVVLGHFLTAPDGLKIRLPSLSRKLRRRSKHMPTRVGLSSRQSNSLSMITLPVADRGSSYADAYRSAKALECQSSCD